MKKLNQLLALWCQTSIDSPLNAIHNDSRKIRPGDLFIAYKGHTVDGRNYIQQALDAGAAAVVYDPQGLGSDFAFKSNKQCLAMPRLMETLPALAKRFYDDPGKDMEIIGVTGTNGKTTVAYQLAQAYAALNQKTAYIGTIGQGQPDSLQTLLNTTPDALMLQKLLHDYKMQEINHVCMEVSSHGLSENRVGGIHFKQAVYTNLSHDHLDYHGTMENYARAKALLFAWPDLHSAIINRDDAWWQTMHDAVPGNARILTYGIREQADVRATDWQIGLRGTTIKVRSPFGEHQMHCKAVGYFNIYNALAVFSSLLASEYSPGLALEAMQSLQSAPGRMQIIAQSPFVIVDFAHSPDALENVLSTLTPLKQARIITVFGCGGNRDKGKRPKMGAIACNYSDITILTSDNPRHEDPEAILDDIAKGMTRCDYRLINRREAIAKALEIAKPNDIIVIAGKGHESYQQIGDIKHHFSDSEVALELLS